MSFISTLFDTISQPENWSVDNILTGISFLILVFSGGFALFQWYVANKTKRTEVLQEIVLQLRFDKDMSNTMQKIDYDQDWYSSDFHNSDDPKNDFEHRVDKLLAYMSYICYLKKQRHLKKEFQILQYEIDRVCASHSIQSYLWSLYHFSKKQNTKCSFQFLIDYAVKHGIIEKDSFYNPNSTKYIKGLKF